MLSIIRHFVLFVENSFSKSVKGFQSDKGGKFINGDVHNLFSAKGILHQQSCPYMPEQNGGVKHKHRSMVDMTLTLLFHASIPMKFWFHAFATATFLLNRFPSTSIRFITPFQKLFGFIPHISHHRIFGCACFPSLKPYNTHKLQPKTAQHVFMDYTQV